MFAISSIGKKLFEKLRRKTYRHGYMAEHVRRGISYQIRALRDQRGWNQGAFSKELDKPQSVVSRLEDPSYGKVTIQTLLEVANVCDVALQVRFVPYSVFLQNTRDVSAKSMEVPSFDDELQEPISVNEGAMASASAIEAFFKVPEQQSKSSWPPQLADPFLNSSQMRLGSMDRFRPESTAIASLAA